jgi:formylglycine-generating enzyme required for sulfatase activity
MLKFQLVIIFKQYNLKNSETKTMTFKNITLILIGLINLLVLFLVLFKIFYPFYPLYLWDSTPNEKRGVALVIANSHYPDNVLANSQNDAKDIAEVLWGYNFTVIHKQDLNQAEMDEAMLEFEQSLTSGGIGLFYFAGHGIQINQQNYLMPIDFKIHEYERQLLKYHAMNAQYPIDVMEAAGSRVKIVILDAAQKNLFQWKKDSNLSDGLAAMHAPTGTIISYATALGKKSSDYNGEGRNGLYTSHLLSAMKTPGLAIKQVFWQAAIQVILASYGEQVPWYSDSLTDENFCFTPPCQQLGKAEKKSWEEKKIKAQELQREAEQNEKSRQAIIEFQRLTKHQPQSAHPSFSSSLNNTQFWFSAEVFSDRLLDGSWGPKMLIMPAGSFWMGDIKGEGWNEEKPAHQVLIDYQFAMGQNEVTVAEFRRFVNATNYKTFASKGEKKGCWVYKDAHWDKPKDANWRNPYFPQNDDHPVVCVSWHDAIAYAEWLSEQTDQQYRLPTEAEWEYAARAAEKITLEKITLTTTLRYWGNDPDDACDYANIADKTSQKNFCDWIMQTGKLKACSSRAAEKITLATTLRYWGDNPDHACDYANVADKTSQSNQSKKSKKTFFSWIMQIEQPKKGFSSWDIHDCTDGYIHTAPVGSFKKNNFDLYDMLGNVWEWCADPWHSRYKNAPVDGSVWKQAGENSLRVIRGGAWNTKPKYVRAAFRSSYSPEDRYYDVGFRLSRSLGKDLPKRKDLSKRIVVNK